MKLTIGTFCWACITLVMFGFRARLPAEDVSAPAMLQMFEASWDTMENRMVDIFQAGYGGIWVPPPSKADSGPFSVGYDVFDRFDLGSPRNETLYGTKTGLKSMVTAAHRAGVRVYTDMILNHNGFRDSSTPGFVSAGDYPGFVTTLPGDIDGDFHGRFAGGEINFRLSGLIDIAQEKNHQFIRHPVESHPDNIPSGSVYDQPDPDNSRFYPDRDLAGTTVWDARLNTNVTLYDFNAAEPFQGDAIRENSLGLMMRHLRWMVQEVGVDGFRLDAARHMERWVLDYLDQAVFLAKQTPLLDGSRDHVFSFSETGYDNYGFLQDFIRKDIDPDNLGQVGGNRDALDFNLFGAIKANLTADGPTNDWRNIKNTSLDVNDDGFANNGSQGLSFVKSHDEIGAYLDSVAHAYILMRPGNALVYLNAKQFGDNRDFPRDGRTDALGGLYGEAVTRLVNIRNTHGRGDYRDRTPGDDEKEMLIYEREGSAVVVLSNRLDGGFDSSTILTSFAPGTPLIELTGNAEDATIDPLDDFPSLLVVKSDHTVDLRVPRNVAPGASGIEHGSGFLIYGVAGPRGQLRLTDAVGNELTSVLSGETPTAATNGTARLSDMTVVSADTMRVRLETGPVHLQGQIRDRHADGDQALLRIDGGQDLNDLPGIDHVTPGSVNYGFEEFRGIHLSGFSDPNGDGLYDQTIDVSKLSEGVHFITARAFRHRNPATTTDDDPGLFGDGGPAVYTDFRKSIYVDRLRPDSVAVSFDAFGQESERDLIAQSVDQTADSMHIFLNLPAAISDTEVRNMAVAGQNRAGRHDRDQWIYGFRAVASGNHVASVVTFEPTGNWSVRRFAGLAVQSELGWGVGDLTWDNEYSPADLIGAADSFETVLFSQNTQFNPAADANADGLVDNRDLFLLGDILQAAGVSAATWDAYLELVLRRGDVNQSGTTDAEDIDWLYANLGQDSWLLDLNADGVTDRRDVAVLVEDIFGTLLGDANLDGAVDVTDFNIWNAHKFQSVAGWSQGDFNGDGVTDTSDFNLWNGNKFRVPYGVAAVPESASLTALLLGSFAALVGRRCRGASWGPEHGR